MIEAATSPVLTREGKQRDTQPATQEDLRLACLRELMVLDTAPEPLFDAIAALASDICGAPIALLSLVDDSRQWFKAVVGVEGVSETPREIAFCAHAIGGDTLFEVPDATLDSRFADNPLVTGPTDIRFYAGAPLIIDGDSRVGTLCVVDHRPNSLSPRQATLLRSLASIASHALMLRRDLTDKALSVRSEYEKSITASQKFLHRTGRLAGVGGWELDLLSQSVTWSDETLRLHDVGPDYVPTLESAAMFYPPEARPTIESAVQRAFLEGKPWDLELPFISATGRHAWVRSVGEVEFENGVPVRMVGAMQDITARKQLEQRLAESERFVREITDQLPVRVAYLDAQKTYRFVNRARCEAFGLEPNRILARRRSELVRDVGDTVFDTRLDLALLGEPQRFEFDEQVNGETRRIESRLVPDIDESGAVRGVFSSGIDITVRNDAEIALRRLIAADVAAKRELQRQSATLRSVTEAIPAIVAVVGSDHRYRLVNGAFERWQGAKRSSIVGHTLAEVMGRIEYERCRPWIERALAGETVDFEKDYPSRSGVAHLGISYIPLWEESGVVDGFVAVAQDITLHKQEEARLVKLTQRDPLTGLLNRTGFEEHLQRCHENGFGDSLAVLYIDLDRFKPVNDDHGHGVGDQLLQAFAQRVARLVRPTDAVARLGGDEFAIVLTGIRKVADADGVAGKVTAAAAAPFEIGKLRVIIGASVGVAHGADPAQGWRELVARADAAMYRAKAAGRGRDGSGAALARVAINQR